MKCVAGDEKLHALSGGDIRSDNDALALAAGMQQEQFERIAEIIMIELVVHDAMQPHRRLAASP